MGVGVALVFGIIALVLFVLFHTVWLHTAAEARTNVSSEGLLGYPGSHSDPRCVNEVFSVIPEEDMRGGCSWTLDPPADLKTAALWYDRHLTALGYMRYQRDCNLWTRGDESLVVEQLDSGLYVDYYLDRHIRPPTGVCLSASG